MKVVRSKHKIIYFSAFAILLLAIISLIVCLYPRPPTSEDIAKSTSQHQVSVQDIPSSSSSEGSDDEEANTNKLKIPNHYITNPLKDGFSYQTPKE